MSQGNPHEGSPEPQSTPIVESLTGWQGRGLSELAELIALYPGFPLDIEFGTIGHPPRPIVHGYTPEQLAGALKRWEAEISKPGKSQDSPLYDQPQWELATLEAVQFMAGPTAAPVGQALEQRAEELRKRLENQYRFGRPPEPRPVTGISLRATKPRAPQLSAYANEAVGSIQGFFTDLSQIGYILARKPYLLLPSLALLACQVFGKTPEARVTPGGTQTAPGPLSTEVSPTFEPTATVEAPTPPVVALRPPDYYDATLFRGIGFTSGYSFTELQKHIALGTAPLGMVPETARALYDNAKNIKDRLSAAGAQEAYVFVRPDTQRNAVLVTKVVDGRTYIAWITGSDAAGNILYSYHPNFGSFAVEASGQLIYRWVALPRGSSAADLRVQYLGGEYPVVGLADQDGSQLAHIFVPGRDAAFIAATEAAPWMAIGEKETWSGEITAQMLDGTTKELAAVALRAPGTEHVFAETKLNSDEKADRNLFYYNAAAQTWVEFDSVSVEAWPEALRDYQAYFLNADDEQWFDASGGWKPAVETAFKNWGIDTSAPTEQIAERAAAKLQAVVDTQRRTALIAAGRKNVEAMDYEKLYHEHNMFLREQLIGWDLVTPHDVWYWNSGPDPSTVNPDDPQTYPPNLVAFNRANEYFYGYTSPRGVDEAKEFSKYYGFGRNYSPKPDARSLALDYHYFNTTTQEVYGRTMWPVFSPPLYIDVDWMANARVAGHDPALAFGGVLHMVDEHGDHRYVIVMGLNQDDTTKEGDLSWDIITHETTPANPGKPIRRAHLLRWYDRRGDLFEISASEGLERLLTDPQFVDHDISGTPYLLHGWIEPSDGYIVRDGMLIIRLFLYPQDAPQK